MRKTKELPADPPDPGELEELEMMEQKEAEEARLITAQEKAALYEEVPAAHETGSLRRAPTVEELRSLKRESGKSLSGTRKKKTLKTFPAPFTVNFHSDHKDIRGRPQAFWDYWRKVYDDPELRDRVVVYIYRLWPVMLDGKRQVAKAYEPFPMDDLLKLYGCGDYFLKLNDAAGRAKMRRTICNCRINKVGDYSLTEYPPYLDLEGLDLTNPHNERYIQWCDSRGITIPGRTKPEDKEDEDVSKVTKVLLDQYMQLTDRLVKDEKGKKIRTKVPSASVVAPMVEVIKTATEGANNIMQKAYERTAELQSRQQDPSEVIGKTVSVLKDLLPKQDDGQAALVSSYLQAMQSMTAQLMKVNSEYTDRMVQMTHERMAQNEKQMTALLETISKGQAAAAQATASNPASPTQSLKDVLKDMAEFKEQLRDIVGLDEEKPTKSGWTEYLPDILKAVTVLGTTIAAAMHNFAVAKTGQGQPVPVAAPVTGPAVPEAAPQAPEQPQAQQQQTQEQESNMLSQYHNLLNMLRPSLLKAFNDGLSGADYAETLIELTDAGLFGQGYTGRQIYDAILEAGEMSVGTVIKTFPPIWDVVKQTPQKWERFLHEFFTADEIWAQEEEMQQQQAQQAKPAKKK